MSSLWQKKNLFGPVSGLSLAVFRIMFGLLCAENCFKYVLEPGYLQRRYFSDVFLFKFQFFEWVQVWPELWMAQLHHWVMGFLALMVMAGIFYRFSIVAFTLMFAYAFYVSEIYYLNHHYLVIIVGILFCFLPANRCLSVDRLLHKQWTDSIPRWSLWSLRSLVEIVLIYAGVAKLNADWLRLEPLGTWLRQDAGWHAFGNLVYNDWFIALGAYGTIALHLIGAPLLFYKRTRLGVFIAYCIFHMLNAYTFSIGIFPWFMIAATLTFFEPDWPRMLLEKFKIKLKGGGESAQDLPAPRLRQKLAFGVVIFWLIVQTLLPLRHFLYPGDVNWTEEGHLYAWHMKLRDKQGELIAFHVRDPVSGKTWLINPNKYLSIRQAVGFRSRPDMLLQFAYYLEDLWRKQGYKDVEVYCESYVSLNGREAALIVDPKADLTTKKWDLRPADWILPLNEPLRHWNDPEREKRQEEEPVSGE